MLTLTVQVETSRMHGVWDCLSLQDDLRPNQLQSQECDLHLKYRGYFWVWVEWLCLPLSPF